MMCSIVYNFFIFFVKRISQILVADAGLGVATRPTLSGRLQPAGDQDRCSAARSSVDPSGSKLDRNGVPKREARDIGKEDMFQTRVV